MLNLILSILFSSILYLFDNNSIQACDFLYTSWFEYHSSLNFCLVLELPLELEGKGNHAIGQVGAGKKKKKNLEQLQVDWRQWLSLKKESQPDL